MTSNEQTTRKRVGNWGTNRGLRPPVRTCSTPGDAEGAANNSQRRCSDSSAAAVRRQALPFWPSIVAMTRVAARAVKAVSRAKRGRSAIEDARSALSARVASRTMIARRPKIATWIYTRSTPPRCTNPRTTSPAETQTAWRERPPRWPRAWQVRRSKTVVAHATVLRLTASPTSSPYAGGTERRPSQTAATRSAD